MGNDSGNKKCTDGWEKKPITHNGKSYCGREGSKAGRFNERCGNDDQCQSNELLMLEIPMEVPVVKVRPVVHVVNEQCKHGICEDGKCRYPNQGIWDDDPNKWRWDNNNGNKKYVRMDGKEINYSQW